ncbi:MAG TPA: DNA topoisomerase I [Candidatus Nitrosocosmicus sp.]
MSKIVANGHDSYTIIVCEKPSAAKRIADALTNSLNQNKNEIKSSSFFSVIDTKGHKYIVSFALGHLYGLSDSLSNSKKYPILDPHWIPLSQKKTYDSKFKSLSFKIDKIIKELSNLSKNASGFINACDYDQEGEVIAYNILEIACQNKYIKSKRAKFSSLTNEEIRNSFDNLLKPNKKLADAGRSRHMIDFIFGINLSRALSNSTKEYSPKGKKYSNLSIGRVQGPTLAFVVDREQEISNHILIPYWNIAADFEKNKKQQQIIKTFYHPQKIDTKAVALAVIEVCKNQFGKITDINNQKTPLRPPHPFNLGDLQHEAYRVFKFPPRYTLALAEKLYLTALISYPRTSSQKLPPSINYKKIITNLANINSSLQDKNINFKLDKIDIKSYSNISALLLSKNTLEPNEGRQVDPAHPAIYPTGEKLKQSLGESEMKLFDLITRRFFSTFGDNASAQKITVTITVKDEYIFKAEEKKILIEGWIVLYRPYSDTSHFITQHILPQINKNDIVKNIDIKLIEKQTQPPSRYNQSSLLQKMEKEKIGTKATRAEIINTLYKRNYITNSVRTPQQNQNISNHQDNHSADRSNNLTLAVSHPPSSIASSSYSTPLSSNSFHTTSTTAVAATSADSNTSKNLRKTKDTTIAAAINNSPGIRPTDLGNALIDLLRKYVPRIVSIEMTRSMEENLEQIETGSTTSTAVVNDAKEELKKAIAFFEQNEKEIGIQLGKVLVTGDREKNPHSKITILGSCPVCRKGSLIIKKATKTKKRFAGCSLYSTDKCNVTAPLPQNGTLKSINKLCETCKWPIISGTGYNQKKRYQWQFCINTQCPSKNKIGKKTHLNDNQI